MILEEPFLLDSNLISATRTAAPVGVDTDIDEAPERRLTLFGHVHSASGSRLVLPRNGCGVGERKGE